MTPKPTKIVDIQAPSDVAATASGRPLVVTNRPVLSDPMVKSAEVAADKPAEPVTRTAKTIKPLAATEASAPSEAKEVVSAPQPPEAASTVAEASKAVSAESPAPVASEAADEPVVARDAAAETAAAEAKAEEARTARQAELEQLIASGKYFVPINAAARKRSRTYALLLAGCALLLAVVLLDVALDAGLIKLSINLPHTHFFK